MPTLLCTAKYRHTLGLPERLVASPCVEGALGPWYANTLNVGAMRMLHYMRGPSLLSVVITLRERSTAEERFARALAELLADIGVDAAFVEREILLMSSFRFAKASDRSKLASLRDQANSARYGIARQNLSLAEVNRRMAETPCGPMDYRSPERVAPELLAKTWRWDRAGDSAR